MSRRVLAVQSHLCQLAVWPLGWVMSLAMLWGSLAHAAPQGMANGLIVKLKAPADRMQVLSVSSQQVDRQTRLGKLAKLAGYPATMRWVDAGASMQHLKVPTPLTTQQAGALAAKLVASGEVEWAEPNVRQSLHQAVPSGGTPNDVYFTSGHQWWAEDLNAALDPMRVGSPNMSRAWAIHRGRATSQVVVAVLDTGYLDHPDLINQILPGYDFVSDTSNDRDTGGQAGRDSDAHDPGDWLTSVEQQQVVYAGCDAHDSSWHGIAVAGAVGATGNNIVGMAGVHWDAKILPVRVVGSCGADLTDVIDAMRWSAGLPVTGAPLNSNPAKVINVSFGGSGSCGQSYQTTINELRALGVLVVASAGNELGAVSRPANCDGVLGVAALNQAGFKANYSNFGSQVDISTVGGDPVSLGNWGGTLGDGGVLTLGNDGTTAPNLGALNAYYYDFGTSMSAPIVAGVAALMWELNPSFTVDELINAIKLTARPHVTSTHMGLCSAQNPGRCICTVSTCGAGILDAERALAYALDTNSYAALSAQNIDSASVVAAAASGVDQAPEVTSPGSSGGGGGGAFSGLEVAGLALFSAWALYRLKAGKL